MQCKPILTCLALLLSSALVAQSNPSSEAANVQAQSETKASQDGQKDSDKTNDSDRDHKLHVRLGGVSVGAGYISSPFFFSPSGLMVSILTTLAIRRFSIVPSTRRFIGRTPEALPMRRTRVR